MAQTTSPTDWGGDVRVVSPPGVRPLAAAPAHDSEVLHLDGDGPGLPGTARLVLLGSPCPATNVLFHALRQRFGYVSVVLEQRVSRRSLLAKRAKKLGLRTVAGQLLFSVVTVPVLQRRGAKRIAAVLDDNDLDVSPIDQPVVHIPSVNSDEGRAVLMALNPTVVVVSGTRVISAKTLNAVKATFVNLHAGVAPQYRGVHGGYWALAEGRPELVGSTVHIIDQGIDTGPVLAQVTFGVTPADSFATYPYLHLAAGVRPLLDAVKPLLAGDAPEIVTPLSDEPSCLRSHPTVWGYLSRRLRHAVS
ncbi:MAG TPA: formyl transferase [Acidimicrobiales bacterium]|nr:formyl transferase [Acidimicrobiales bacterium]